MYIVAELVEIAADIRTRAGQEQPAFSTRQIIERCFPEVLVTGAHLPDGVDEVFARRESGPVILYKRSLSGPEQRFAIAHAIAHLLFDADGTGASVGCAGDPAREERADRFAMELLAPLAEIRPYVGRYPCDDPDEHELYLDQVDEIASHFVVPAWVIQTQIRQLMRFTEVVDKTG